MKNMRPVVFALLSIAVVAGCVADDDDHEHGGGWFGRSLDVAPVESALYIEECGSCHFAYQPGLLNTPSWGLVMDGLADHFGDNAELDAATEKDLRSYLLDNAADRSDYKRSRKIAASQERREPLLRISDTPYFIRKHDELPSRMVTDNPEIGSYSRCGVCHTSADSGSYDDDAVRIPGVGKWDD